MESFKKGFTLMELLIVIGILAVLSTVVVLVINPAQLLAQARDAQRISDLGSVKSALGYYLATADTPTLGVQARAMNNATCGLNAGVCTVNAIMTVANAGWVGVNLTDAAGGSPLSSLPVDPTNNATYQYAYNGDNTAKTFELNTRLESTKYRGLMATDGGDKSTCATYIEATCYYEIGTDPDLNL